MKNKKLLVFIILIFIFALPIFNVCAQTAGSAGSKYGLTNTAQVAELTETGEVSRPQDIVAKIVGYILAMLGVVFLVQIIFAGYGWMLAGGNEEKIKKAKDKITNSVIGLAIVLLAYIVSSAIFDLLYKVL